MLEFVMRALVAMVVLILIGVLPAKVLAFGRAKEDRILYKLLHRHDTRQTAEPPVAAPRAPAAVEQAPAQKATKGRWVCGPTGCRLVQ